MLLDQIFWDSELSLFSAEKGKQACKAPVYVCKDVQVSAA